MNSITLQLPLLEIRPTVDNNGYVITDYSGTEHFFYTNGSDPLIYDGYCTPVTIVAMHKIAQIVEDANTLTHYSSNNE